MTEITLVPAYGRKYASDDEMMADWNAGKDFRVYPNNRYTSIRDLPILKQSYDRVALTSDFWMYRLV
jgi:hypothetical protein